MAAILKFLINPKFQKLMRYFKSEAISRFSDQIARYLIIIFLNLIKFEGLLIPVRALLQFFGLNLGLQCKPVKNYECM